MMGPTVATATPRPGKIVAIGLNYAAHAAQIGRAIAAAPQIFFKAPSAVIGEGDAIVLPRQSAWVEHEAELGVVIGRRLRRVSGADALAGVAGYCCANDVSARDIQHADGLPDYAKSFDTFCPLGPVVPAASVDPADLEVQCLVNGEVRQRGRTSELLHPVAGLLAHITAAMTLEPGDVVLTGTPAGTGRLCAGDTVTIRIEGVGSLTNPVIAEADPPRGGPAARLPGV
ncbi:2-keto-4-pentenoate hydratase/2-oxohepta-3-ene-1,7-dioic acid hydratase in catechol pathway [Catenulispora sp. GP43]|uniref:fumarylacetoacetate hydrolase family protein n=1 Tax=Catenulispora sp. GP43 TaxID=3156263 RepID=UPI003511C88A